MLLVAEGVVGDEKCRLPRLDLSRTAKFDIPYRATEFKGVQRDRSYWLNANNGVAAGVSDEQLTNLRMEEKCVLDAVGSYIKFTIASLRSPPESHHK